MQLAVEGDVGVDGHLGDVGGGQIARVTAHLRVTETVVRERRLVVGGVAPVARVRVRLLRAAEVVVVEGAVRGAVGLVLGYLGVADLHDGAGRESGDADAAHPRRVVAEVDDLLARVGGEAIDGDGGVGTRLGDVRDRREVHLAVRAAVDDDHLGDARGPALLARVVRLPVVDGV